MSESQSAASTVLPVSELEEASLPDNPGWLEEFSSMSLWVGVSRTSLLTRLLAWASKGVTTDMVGRHRSLHSNLQWLSPDQVVRLEKQQAAGHATPWGQRQHKSAPVPESQCLLFHRGYKKSLVSQSYPKITEACAFRPQHKPRQIRIVQSIAIAISTRIEHIALGP